ncbi:MAG: ComF family protein [Candidatus Promineifilaceae bacterium]|nr:ComF family protein [Candidatus Promineifilaceae bacterium]
MSPDFNLLQVRTTLVYREPVTTVIHALKYKGLFALSKPLAQLMIDSWPIWDEAPELLIPVPLHPQRKKQRGFNQSELLVNYLGQKRDIPVALHALQRVKKTAPQVGLSPRERQENVRDAFLADPNAVAGKQILLIDDVYTTGSTMMAAAKALLSARAIAVSAYCLAGTV